MNGGRCLIAACRASLPHVQCLEILAVVVAVWIVSLKEHFTMTQRMALIGGKALIINVCWTVATSIAPFQAGSACHFDEFC